MLNYKIYRKDKTSQWVTFVHGAGGSSVVWSPQLREYSKLYNVLLLNLRGHGNSKEEHQDKSEYTMK
jgi:pimeloyl-ACP methyl ester carboxylesterase